MGCGGGFAGVVVSEVTVLGGFAWGVGSGFRRKSKSPLRQALITPLNLYPPKSRVHNAFTGFLLGVK